MKRHIILTPDEHPTLGQVAAAVEQAREVGLAESSKVVGWYDPSYLVDRLVIEEGEPVTELSNDELLTRFRTGELGGYGPTELWDEISRRLRATGS